MSSYCPVSAELVPFYWRVSASTTRPPARPAPACWKQHTGSQTHLVICKYCMVMQWSLKLPGLLGTLGGFRPQTLVLGTLLKIEFLTF